MPTPAGVPVKKMSPGWSVIASETYSMICGMLKIRSSVEDSCFSTSFTQSCTLSACGSGTSSRVTR